MRRLMLAVLMLTLTVPLGCTSRGWKVQLRVGPGRVEATPGGFAHLDPRRGYQRGGAVPG